MAAATVDFQMAADCKIVLETFITLFEIKGLNYFVARQHLCKENGRRSSGKRRSSLFAHDFWANQFGGGNNYFSTDG